MQKTPSPLTLAAAAVLALAGSSTSFGAFAQGTSSVTLYGIVDVGVEHLNNVAAGGGLSRMPSTTSLVPSRWACAAARTWAAASRPSTRWSRALRPTRAPSTRAGAALGAKAGWDWAATGAA